jgi:hypothetical protein
MEHAMTCLALALELMLSRCRSSCRHGRYRTCQGSSLMHDAS